LLAVICNNADEAAVIQSSPWGQSTDNNLYASPITAAQIVERILAMAI